MHITALHKATAKDHEKKDHDLGALNEIVERQLKYFFFFFFFFFSSLFFLFPFFFFFFFFLVSLFFSFFFFFFFFRLIKERSEYLAEVQTLKNLYLDHMDGEGLSYKPSTFKVFIFLFLFLFLFFLFLFFYFNVMIMIMIIIMIIIIIIIIEIISHFFFLGICSITIHYHQFTHPLTKGFFIPFCR